VEQIINNVMQVEKMRIGPNELVFSEVFLLEHKQIIGRLSNITGITVEKINKMVRKKMQSTNRQNRMHGLTPVSQFAEEVKLERGLPRSFQSQGAL
jgi:succinyl-CoA synthetase beta subunit